MRTQIRPSARNRMAYQSVNPLNRHGYGGRAIKNRYIAVDLADNHDPAFGNLAGYVIDDKMMRSPDPERPGAEVALTRDLLERGGKLPTISWRR